VKSVQDRETYCYAMTDPHQPHERLRRRWDSQVWVNVRNAFSASASRWKSRSDAANGDRTSWLATVPAPVDPIPPEGMQTQDRRDFRQYVLSKLFAEVCTCDECAPHLYLDHTTPCINEHRRSDLHMLLRDGSLCRPDLSNRVEALYLVKETIEFFSRRREHMSPIQLAALQNFQVLKTDLLGPLNQEDCSSVPHGVMIKLINLLDNIFFMGSLGPDVAFTWEGDNEQQENGSFGRTDSWINSRGHVVHEICMDPIDIPVRGRTTLASARLGILLHEMLHAFIYRCACTECCTSPANVDGSDRHSHGRAWHRLATALEQYAPELLGTAEIDLGRWMMLKQWIERLREAEQDGASFEYGRVWKPSIHDVRSFGFV